MVSQTIFMFSSKLRNRLRFQENKISLQQGTPRSYSASGSSDLVLHLRQIQLSVIHFNIVQLRFRSIHFNTQYYNFIGKPYIKRLSSPHPLGPSSSSRWPRTTTASIPACINFILIRVEKF